MKPGRAFFNGLLKALDDGPWKSRISEPKQKGFARWHGDDAARRAVTNSRTRLLSGVAREAFKLRAEIVERSFAHNLDRGGMRRTWLRGRENVHKRYLLHVAGHNLSLLMRQLIGAGTPKEAVAGGIGALFVLVTPAGAVLVVQIVLIVSECQWRSKKGPPRRCKKGPLGGCGLVPVVHGRAPRATRRALNRLTRRRAREGPVGPRGQAWAGWSVQLAVGV